MIIYLIPSALTNKSEIKPSNVGINGIYIPRAYGPRDVYGYGLIPPFSGFISDLTTNSSFIKYPLAMSSNISRGSLIIDLV